MRQKAKGVDSIARHRKQAKAQIVIRPPSHYHPGRVRPRAHRSDIPPPAVAGGWQLDATSKLPGNPANLAISPRGFGPECLHDLRITGHKNLHAERIQCRRQRGTDVGDLRFLSEAQPLRSRTGP
jgi:hypothetical protein